MINDNILKHTYYGRTYDKKHMLESVNTRATNCDTVPEIHRSVSEPQSKCKDRESADVCVCVRYIQKR